MPISMAMLGSSSFPLLDVCECARGRYRRSDGGGELDALTLRERHKNVPVTTH